MDLNIIKIERSISDLKNLKSSYVNEKILKQLDVEELKSVLNGRDSQRPDIVNKRI